MHIVSMDVGIHHALEAVRTAERIRPNLNDSVLGRFIFQAAWFFYGPRTRKLSVKIADSCTRLRMYATTIKAAAEGEVIDPNLELRGHLDELKDSAKEACRVMGSALESLAELGQSESAFAREFRTILDLSIEMVEVANMLQWEVAEHDADYSRRREGFTASNKEELDAMFNRLLAGE